MIRQQLLPIGWYPRDPQQIRDLLQQWEREDPLPSDWPPALSVIAPHAGWSFSGAPAYRAVRHLEQPQTVVIVGGHLGSSSPVLLFPEDGFETPFGELTVDTGLRQHLTSSLQLSSDGSPDNSVDVFLPMVGALFPESSVVCLRAPANRQAVQLGEAIADFAGGNPGVGVIGSTDLTHYGSNFAFAPAGSGPEAVEWARRNDSAFLRLCEEGNAEGAVQHALENRSACSPGAAAAAMSFARRYGARTGSVLEQTSSYDVRPADSFVGYGSVTYPAAGE
jgi:hypothetical protein